MHTPPLAPSWTDGRTTRHPAGRFFRGVAYRWWIAGLSVMDRHHAHRSSRSPTLARGTHTRKGAQTHTLDRRRGQHHA